MQDTTTTKHRDILNILSGSEEPLKPSSTLIETEQIEGTPFHAVKQQEKWFLTLGNYRLTEPTLTKEETINKLNTELWKIIFHVIIIVNEKDKEIHNLPTNEGAE